MEPQQPHSNRQLADTNIPQERLRKMDILIYNSIKKMRKKKNIAIIYTLTKLLIIAIFIPIDIEVLETDQTRIIAVMWIYLGVCVFNSVLRLGFNQFFKDGPNNNTLMLGFAQNTNHCVINEYFLKKDIGKLQNCVSATIYNAQIAILSNDRRLTKKIKKHYENIYAGLIQYFIVQQHPGLNYLSKLGKFFSIVLLVIIIIALVSGDPNVPEIVVLSVLAALEAWNIMIFIIIVLVLAFLPLICIVACFLACCDRKHKENSAKLNIPQQKKATLDMIQKTDGSCSICFQAFLPDQQVIVLPCSPKHMFHTGCLNNWLIVSKTCPLCRFCLQEQNPEEDLHQQEMEDPVQIIQAIYEQNNQQRRAQ